METPAFEADHLTKRFGATHALEDVSFAVAPGEVLGFLGPNGAGKSTTIRLLLGLLRPSSGHARVTGAPAGSAAARRASAYVPGDVALWPQLTGLETLEMMAALHGSVDLAYRDELIERFGLDPSVRARAYSKGNRQKVALIGAFMTRAPALALDEPTAGLDPLVERQFRRCVTEARERGQAILLSSHVLAEVEHLADRVAMIRDGRLVAVASVDDLRAHAGTSLDVVGEPGDLRSVPGVTHVEPLPDGVRVRVEGDLAPLLAALSSTRVDALRTREASLEEIFLSYYDEPA